MSGGFHPFKAPTAAPAVVMTIELVILFTSDDTMAFGKCAVHRLKRPSVPYNERESSIASNVIASHGTLPVCLAYHLR